MRRRPLQGHCREVGAWKDHVILRAQGPPSRGANEALMHTFDEIGIRPEESLEEAAAQAKAWMEHALANKKKVMDFGHRVYKHGDSRARTPPSVTATATTGMAPSPRILGRQTSPTASWTPLNWRGMFEEL